MNRMSDHPGIVSFPVHFPIDIICVNAQHERPQAVHIHQAFLAAKRAIEVLRKTDLSIEIS